MENTFRKHVKKSKYRIGMGRRNYSIVLFMSGGLLVTLQTAQADPNPYWTQDNGSVTPDPYWTQDNGSVTPDMKKFHILLDWVDTTFRHGKDPLRVCMESLINNNTLRICNHIDNVPKDKNYTLHVRYFVMPANLISAANFSLYACVGIKFQEIFDCKSDNFREGVAHFDMGALTYAEIFAVTECVKIHKVGTHAYYECVK